MSLSLLLAYHPYLPSTTLIADAYTVYSVPTLTTVAIIRFLDQENETPMFV